MGIDCLKLHVNNSNSTVTRFYCSVILLFYHLLFVVLLLYYSNFLVSISHNNIKFTSSLTYGNCFTQIPALKLSVAVTLGCLF